MPRFQLVHCAVTACSTTLVVVKMREPRTFRCLVVVVVVVVLVVVALVRAVGVIVADEVEFALDVVSGKELRSV